MKIALHKLCCLLLCLLTLSALIALPAAAQEKTVRMGWYEDAYNITGKHGERSGYAYEFEQAVAAYTGWNYEYVHAGWSDLFNLNTASSWLTSIKLMPLFLPKPLPGWSVACLQLLRQAAAVFILPLTKAVLI